MRTAMIAITTSSSISVNACRSAGCFVFMQRVRGTSNKSTRMNWANDLETKRLREAPDLRVDRRLGTAVSAVATCHLLSVLLVEGLGSPVSAALNSFPVSGAS